MSEVKILLLDLDGVLTSGQVYVDSEGKQIKAFHTHDNRAIAEFVANGWEVHIVSASGFEGGRYYTKNTGAVVHTDVVKNAENIQKITRGQSYIAVGDDLFDLEMLAGAQTAYLPPNKACGLWKLLCEKKGSSFSVVELGTYGGKGVVAELARHYFGGEE